MALPKPLWERIHVTESLAGSLHWVVLMITFTFTSLPLTIEAIPARDEQSCDAPSNFHMSVIRKVHVLSAIIGTWVWLVA